MAGRQTSNPRLAAVGDMEPVVTLVTIKGQLDVFVKSMEHLEGSVKEVKDDTKNIDARVTGIEHKVSLFRGVFLAFSLFGASVSFVGLLIGAAYALKRLFFGG